MIELLEWQSADLSYIRNVSYVQAFCFLSTHLCIARISIEDVGKEFTRASHASDDQTMNVEAINNKEMR